MILPDATPDLLAWAADFVERYRERRGGTLRGEYAPDGSAYVLTVHEPPGSLCASLSGTGGDPSLALLVLAAGINGGVPRDI